MEDLQEEDHRHTQDTQVLRAQLHILLHTREVTPHHAEAEATEVEDLHEEDRHFHTDQVEDTLVADLHKEVAEEADAECQHSTHLSLLIRIP